MEGSWREQLKKYKKFMDRMFYFFWALTLIVCFLQVTVILEYAFYRGMFGLAGIIPSLTVLQAQVLTHSILSLLLLVVIPAIYVIIVEMETKREKIIGVALLLLGWFFSLHMREWNDNFIFRVTALIVASYGKDFKKIARYRIVIVSAGMVIVGVLTLLSVVPEFNLERNGRIRHSFGITGPTGFAAQLSLMLLIVMFLRDGILRWYDYCAIIVLMAFNLIFVDGRVAFLSTMLGTGGCIVKSISQKRKWELPKGVMNVFRRLLASAFVLIAAVYMFMMLTYDKDGFAIFRKIPFLSSFESRFEVPSRLFKELGVSVFGNYLAAYNDAEHSFEQGELYNFLDSSYARMLMIYGVVGLALTLLVFSGIQYRLLKKKMTFRLYILAVVALNYVVERQLMDPLYNTFVLLLFATIPPEAGEPKEDPLVQEPDSYDRYIE